MSLYQSIMGICASCLGLRRRESHGGESTRLLDDDIYQPGYGYGGVNQSQRNGPDSEDVKREREALDGICQNTSDGIVDVWTAQQGYTSLAQRPKTAFSSRMPSAESAVTQVLAHSRTATPTQDQKEQKEQQLLSHDHPGQVQDHPRETAPTLPAAHGEFGNMKYVADVQYSPDNDPSTAPKHWGEVVMSTRKSKKASAADDVTKGKENGDAIFGALAIK